MERTGLSIAQLRAAPKTCPAADKHGDGVMCRIERSFLPYFEHPASVARWCCGDYQSCPSWRAERENEIAQRRLLKTLPLVGEREGV